MHAVAQRQMQAAEKRMKAAEQAMQRRQADADNVACAEAASLQAARRRLMQREAELAHMEVSHAPFLCSASHAQMDHIALPFSMHWQFICLLPFSAWIA